MAISVDWPTKVIFVPRNDMLLVQTVPSEVRELDINAFRLELKSIEAGEGIPFVDTHSHNPPVTVGGVTLARVVEIINGYTVTFEDAQYAVNLVGANSNIADVTNVNQVSVRSANSAGLTYSKEIEDQSFLDGRVWIDIDNGNIGTQFPRGTPPDPVNNSNDADGIVSNRGLMPRFWLRGFTTMSAIDVIAREDWVGEGPITAGLTFISTDVTNATLTRLYVTGDMRGPFTLEFGLIDGVTNFEGSTYNTGFGGITTIPSGASGSNVIMRDCYSSVAGTGTPIFDFNNASNVNWQLRGWTGGVEVRNYTDAGNLMSVDLHSGHLIIDSSCTDGIIVVRGDGYITDNSAGAVTLITDGLGPVWTETEKDASLLALSTIADAVTLLQKYEENRTVIDKIANTLTVYDDDDVTPILVFSLLDTTGTPSTAEVAERVPI